MDNLEESVNEAALDKGNQVPRKLSARLRTKRRRSSAEYRSDCITKYRSGNEAEGRVEEICQSSASELEDIISSPSILQKRTKQRSGSGGKDSKSAKTGRLGTILGRSKANPLKHLAIILLKKLQSSQGKACNLLQIAKEIHSEAKDKHNPTLRRIYDVVNVCEGAGLLVRTFGSSSKRIAVLQRSLMISGPKNEPSQYNGSQVPRPIQPFPAEEGASNVCLKLKGKRRSSRGTEIRWLGPIPANSRVQLNLNQLLRKKQLLLRYRDEILARLTEKKREYQNLVKQLQMKYRLVDYNQDRVCSSISNDEGVPNPSIFHSVQEATDLKLEQTSVCWDDSFFYDGSLCDLLENGLKEECCSTFGVEKVLLMPFVIIATESRTNIDITMEGDPTYRVNIRFDDKFQLYDHIQLIELLLNKHKPVYENL
ncbi:hypothetical protein O6H91_15G021700 [Diphasiastrum complanatum]|uniref:Uncharacterized protein n=3 Tax=Diphasiastrum complanatum TaxID=34168 RepID=A0ACC2BH98_DIPCM|nr:hypothetical protein O6H91_15G021700 [Diphasiastrum complanatum]KAJ7528821.1 hypothetical protein O6H91_15G021700 [Diphasiastrum complanatum]KAJ7528822.1 hypothetical protein O6H91_15G021700 [Diphasiastrum complanatum]